MSELPNVGQRVNVVGLNPLLCRPGIVVSIGYSKVHDKKCPVIKLDTGHELFVDPKNIREQE